MCAFTAPRTWTTGELVTAAQMNEQVKDNEVYLKTEVDRLGPGVPSSHATTLGTQYQNTSGKAVLLITKIYLSSSGTGANAVATFTTGPDTGPTGTGSYNSECACSLSTAGQSLTVSHTMTFIVPNNWYWKIVQTFATASIGSVYLVELF